MVLRSVRSYTNGWQWQFSSSTTHSTRRCAITLDPVSVLRYAAIIALSMVLCIDVIPMVLSHRDFSITGTVEKRYRRVMLN